MVSSLGFNCTLSCKYSYIHHKPSTLFLTEYLISLVSKTLLPHQGRNTSFCFLKRVMASLWFTLLCRNLLVCDEKQDYRPTHLHLRASPAPHLWVLFHSAQLVSRCPRFFPPSSCLFMNRVLRSEIPPRFVYLNFCNPSGSLPSRKTSFPSHPREMRQPSWGLLPDFSPSPFIRHPPVYSLSLNCPFTCQHIGHWWVCMRYFRAVTLFSMLRALHSDWHTCDG